MTVLTSFNTWKLHYNTKVFYFLLLQKYEMYKNVMEVFIQSETTKAFAKVFYFGKLTGRT